MRKKYTRDIIEYAYYGIEENIDADEIVEVNLRDLMKIHATLAELTQYFHQPLHYQSVDDISEYLGNVNDKKGYALLHKAKYEILSRMLPLNVMDMFDEGCFDNPESPFYFAAKD